jgi:hypothetical protein
MTFEAPAEFERSGHERASVLISAATLFALRSQRFQLRSLILSGQTSSTLFRDVRPCRQPQLTVNREN